MEANDLQKRLENENEAQIIWLNYVSQAIPANCCESG